MDKHVSAGENLELENMLLFHPPPFPKKNSVAEYQQLLPQLLAKARREGDFAKGNLLNAATRATPPHPFFFFTAYLPQNLVLGQGKLGTLMGTSYCKSLSGQVRSPQVRQEEIHSQQHLSCFLLQSKVKPMEMVTKRMTRDSLCLGKVALQG